MSHESEHNLHRTFGDLIAHRSDCNGCAAIIAAQKTAVLEMLENHRVMVHGFVEGTRELARRSAEALDGLLPRLATPAAVREVLAMLDATSKSLTSMLRRSVRLGQLGWLVPDEISLTDLEYLLRESTNAASADRTFEILYGSGAGPAFDDLRSSVLGHPRLRPWRELLEDVFFALGAGRPRLCVPALFATFEGVAADGWHKDFHKPAVRARFFKATLRRLDPGSVEFYEFTTMDAFVATMYKNAGHRDPKPPLLNRHWIMHGRGVPDANLSDCLRLLLAVRAAAQLAE